MSFLNVPIKIGAANFKKIFRPPHNASLVLWVLIVVAAAFIARDALVSSTGALTLNIIKNASPIVFLALGAGLVLAIGQVDISTAGVATLTGILWSLLITAVRAEVWWHALGWLMLLVTIPLLFGAVAGYLVTVRRAPSLIITWALGLIAALIGVLIATSVSPEIYNATVSGVRYEAMFDAGTWNKLRGAGIISTTALLVVAALSFFQLPRQCEAVGANWQSARYLGIGVKRVERAAFLSSAILSGVAGVFAAEIGQSATTTDLFGYELIAVAVAVLGGTVMSGGYFAGLSIIVAATGWSALRAIATLSEFLGLDGRGPEVIFAILIIILAFLLGSRLSGNTRAIHVRYDHE